MDLALRSLVDVAIDLYPSPIREQLRDSTPDLLIDAARLGLEVLQAERAGHSFAEAVRRPRDFPLMQRVHFGFLALLQFEIPAPWRNPIRELLRRAKKIEADELGQALFATAGYDNRTAEPALLRFLIYQLLRVGVWTGTFDDVRVEAAGCHRGLDEWAEQLLRKRLSMAEMYQDEVRPMEVLFAEAMMVVRDKTNERLSGARLQGAAVLEVIETVMAQAEAARRLPATRAEVLRNDYAEELGGEKLGDVQMADWYPDLYPSKNAVQQHRSRLRKTVASGKVEVRRARLIDLLRELEGDDD